MPYQRELTALMTHGARLLFVSSSRSSKSRGAEKKREKNLRDNRKVRRSWNRRRAITRTARDWSGSSASLIKPERSERNATPFLPSSRPIPRDDRWSIQRSRSSRWQVMKAVANQPMTTISADWRDLDHRGRFFMQLY